MRDLPQQRNGRTPQLAYLSLKSRTQRTIARNVERNFLVQLPPCLHQGAYALVFSKPPHEQAVISSACASPRILNEVRFNADSVGWQTSLDKLLTRKLGKSYIAANQIVPGASLPMEFEHQCSRSRGQARVSIAAVIYPSPDSVIKTLFANMTVAI